jgi:hypothetical protein
MGVPFFIPPELSQNGGRFSEMKFTWADKMFKFYIPAGKN